ncbi:MAG: MBG domain-containing protein, partial [Collinsella sp.]|nr:MBG domain-containing protein [Collinsella sp.]
KIAPADQAAPKDVKTTAATGHALADGSIDGIDNTYEWKAEAASDYQRIAEGETSVKGLAAGKYCVRLKADRNHNASEALTVEVKDGPKKADGNGWKHDDAEHWNTCTCGKEDVDRAKHDFEWVVDQAAAADKPGSKHERCKTCGYERESVEIPAFGIKGYSDEYDGAYHTVDATSLPKGATAKYSTDGKNWSPEAPKIKDVGTLTVCYEVTIDGVKAEGKVILEVKPRAITVTAQDASKTYGEADPVFTWDVTSGKLVAGETLQGLEIKREDSDNVRDGGYALQLTQPEGANPNYSITFVDGTFTINQRLLAVTWGTTEFTYDGKEHCPVATLGNVIGKDDLGATVEGSQVEAGASYTASLTALTGKAAGNYKLPAEGLTCEFSIKKAPQGAPVVQAAAETVSGKRDGKITGVDATMEWRAKGADEYQAVGEGVTELKDLAAGVYEVRYQAKANYDVSSVTEITVAAGRKLVVALPTNQQGYTLTATATELDWHGSATLTVSIDSAYFAGKGYAVKVDGKAIELSDKGTYELKDVEGDVNVTVEGVLKHEPDGSGWAHDAKNHWHICRCDDIIDKAEHTFRWVVDKPATTEAKGKKHQECTVCGEKGVTEEIAILVPEIIDGKGQTMVVDAVKDLSFRSSAPLAFFQKVLVDDKEVAAENYVLTEGSTIVTLKASFLNTLGVGEHRLSVVSTTGTAETTFTVAEAAKPAPGQTTTTTTSKPKKRASKEALPESGDSTYVIAGAVLAAGVAVLLLAWAIMKRRA